MSAQLLNLLWQALLETLAMTAAAGAVAIAFGTPVAVALNLTAPDGLRPHPWFNRALGAIVNAARSVPFVILMVAIIPLTRLIAGTSIGTAAAIVPLSLAAIPFFARLAENALRETDRGLITAARAMGATHPQIVFKVLLPEALPGLIAAATVTLIGLIGYSAMAGAIGGGGLGDLGIRYGYQRFQPWVMAAVVLVLIVLVQGVQSLGDALVRRLSHR